MKRNCRPRLNGFKDQTPSSRLINEGHEPGFLQIIRATDYNTLMLRQLEATNLSRQTAEF